MGTVSHKGGKKTTIYTSCKGQANEHAGKKMRNYQSCVKIMQLLQSVKKKKEIEPKRKTAGFMHS